MILKCKRCNKEFDAKRKDTMYCSACKKKVASERTMRSRKKYHPEVQVGVGSGGNSRNRGYTHGSYKTGVTAYRNLIPVEVCTWCGDTKHLLVHHLDENRYNNSLDNLICLCKRCHQALHTKRDPVTGRYLAK